MKKVLIALDYDPSALKIAEAGCNIAKCMQAEITLLHVISDKLYYSSVPYSSFMGFAGSKDIVIEESGNVDMLTEIPKRYLENAKNYLNDESIQTMVKGGDFADSIIETALGMHADIIVMGSHSRSWLSEILVGSVTEKVLHQSTIPLLVIPTKNRS